VDEGEPWLGLRQDTFEVYWFDPRGRFEARRLARATNRGPLVHGRSVYITRADERDLVRIALGDNGEILSTEVLVEGVGFPRGWMFHDAWQPRSILVLRDDGDMIDVDLESGELEIVQTGVRWFSTSDDQRWVIWSQGHPAQATEPLPREMWLLDRQTGDQERIAFDDDEEIFAQILGQHLMAHALEEDDSTRATLFRWLPGGETRVIEGRWFPFGQHASGVFGAIEMSLAPETGIDVWIPENGELKRVAGPIESYNAGSEGLWVEEPVGEPVDSVGGGGPYDLLLFSFETLQLELVEHRMYDGVAIDDTRWVQVVEVDYGTDALGDLRVLDDATGESRIVDQSVFVEFERHEPHGFHRPRPWRSDEIVYQVRDSGSRTGLWRVRFAD
jgi:hypothetical protein